MIQMKASRSIATEQEDSIFYITTMSNIFRSEYRELEPGEKDFLKSFKEKAQSLYDMIDGTEGPENIREMKLAKTKLEEAVMWAVKGITQ